MAGVCDAHTLIGPFAGPCQLDNVPGAKDGAAEDIEGGAHVADAARCIDAHASAGSDGHVREVVEPRYTIGGDGHMRSRHGYNTPLASTSRAGVSSHREGTGS